MTSYCIKMTILDDYSIYFGSKMTCFGSFFLYGRSTELQFLWPNTPIIRISNDCLEVRKFKKIRLSDNMRRQENSDH